jgi:hypothetical protein
LEDEELSFSFPEFIVPPIELLNLLKLERLLSVLDRTFDFEDEVRFTGLVDECCLDDLLGVF